MAYFFTAVRHRLDELALNSQTDLKKIADVVSTSHSQLEAHITDAKNEIKTELRTELRSRDAQATIRRSDKRQAERRQDLLDALAFPDMNQRSYHVTKDTAPGTTKWIFDMAPDDDQPKWANFGTWLREDDSVYWISGKAGSGKSTLVANIVQDERTKEGLAIWSGGNAVHIVSFYFWKPGSELQKSVLGLMRSLLYQICKAQPSVLDSILATVSPASMRATWDEGKYAEAVHSALSNLTDSRFCLFIEDRKAHV